MPRSAGDLHKRLFVYMLASKPRGVLYVGVTSNHAKRTWEHREGIISGFTKRYFVRRLVRFEKQADALTAIEREKQIKRWRREWKCSLIENRNPHWHDLYDELAL